MKTIIILLCLSCLSCATIIKGNSEEVLINTNPSKAVVYLEGKQVLCVTPCTVKLTSSKSYLLRVFNEGYKDEYININSDIGVGWIILDIITGVVPLFIDAISECWYQLEPSEIDINLEKSEKF